LGGHKTGAHPFFEDSVVLFRGCGARAVQKWVAQCHRADTGLTAHCRTVAGMASPGGLAKQCWDMIPRRCQRHGEDSSLTRAPALCQNIKCSGQGSGCGSSEPVRASSEGASSPRARQSLARGGVQPSNEAESHPRGRPSLEQGGALSVWCRIPRAKRSFARGGLGLSVLVGR
jgi:hypothetical protein